MPEVTVAGDHSSGDRETFAAAIGEPPPQQQSDDNVIFTIPVQRNCVGNDNRPVVVIGDGGRGPDTVGADEQ